MIGDGIHTSGRPRGSLALLWLRQLEAPDAKVRDRLLRGRTLARAGRIRELDVAPGQVFAEVVDGESRRACLRVATYDEDQWRKVLEVLTERLDRIAQLLEGTLDLELVEAAERHGVHLVPLPGEVECDCDCGDWAVPCAHCAALHELVAEGLDGDPLMLLTLRGRTRDQLLAELRRWYGDPGRTEAPGADAGEPPPSGDPLDLAAPLPPLTFRFGAQARQPGIAELGPLEGDPGLERILAPMYAAGASAAADLALSSRPTPEKRKRRAASVPPPSAVAYEGDTRPDPGEAVVDALAGTDAGISAAVIGRRLGWTEARTRAELENLEALGMVGRTGKGPREVWWLG
jgi:hypothetical protein